jgi:transglutaminase-like putative cysteine protease
MLVASSICPSSRRIASLVLCIAAISALGAGAQGAPAQGAPAQGAPARAASPWDGPAFSLDPAAALAAAKELSGKEGDDAVYALESDSYRFQADGSAVYRQHVIYKIALKKGVERRSAASCSYQPWRQDRPEIRARVIGQDGAVYNLDPATIADQSRREDADVYSDSRILTAPLPGLEPGALVEYEVVLRDRSPLLAAGGAFRAWFGRGVPILERRLSLEYPSSMPLRYELRGPGAAGIKATKASSGGRSSIDFEMDALPGLGELEDFLADDAVPETCVDFSTGSSWQAVAAAYAAIAEPVIASTSVADYAASALKGLEKGTKAERVAAVLYRLRRDIRYTGINFGENAIIPHAPADTIARGYGDCKDQASLLAASLRAAGMDARLALLEAGSGSDLLDALPGFGLFNHAIVYLPGEGEWIDPTASYYRPGELPPMDRGRRALVVGPSTGSLRRTPESKPEDNRYREVRAFALSESGASSVLETTTATGIIEAGYRGHFGSGDRKAAREQLEKYVKDVYLSEKLEDFGFSDVQDMRESFSLKLSAAKAKRGFTDSSSSIVVLQSGALLNFLPSFLVQKPRGGKDFERKNDVKLDEPYVAEIEFRLAPPPGFKAAALPEPSRRAMGPAFLASSYKLEGDGSVTALFRFDCVKGSYTAGEAKALHDAVIEYGEEEAATVSFEQVGDSLLSAGKYREALGEFRTLAALHPAEALHHIQLSNALEAAGFGAEARAEARRAVELEPGSAEAHARLAWTLLLDPFARTFEEGCDLAAATAEYAEAARLAPSEALYTVNRAIIAEYGTDLARYGRGARLDEALALYAKVEKDLKGGNWENNVPYDLLRLGRFKELKDATKGPGQSKRRKALFVTAVAAVDGPAAALREAARVSAASDERSEVQNLASQMLITARRYPESAELMIAGARGSQSQTQALAFAESLKKVKAVDAAALSRAEPSGLIASFILAVLQWDGKVDSIAPFFAESVRASLAEPDADREAAAAFSSVAANLSGEEQPPAVVIDLVTGLGKVDVIESGPAIAALFSFPLMPSRKGEVFYLKREGGELRLLDAGGGLSGVAHEVFSLLDSGRTEDARAWLSLVAAQRDLNPLFPSLEDHPVLKLLGDPAKAGPADMRLAASFVLAASRSKADGALGLPALLARLETEKDKDLAARLAKVAALALLRQGRAAEAAAVSARLEASAGDEYADHIRLLSLDAAGESARADRLLAEALAKEPASVPWLRAATEHAARMGRFEDAIRYSGAVIATGHAEESDYNQSAWYSLFTDKPDYAALDGRQIAQRLMGASSASVHTLACVLADSGRFLEAQEAFRKYLSAERTERDPSSAWLAFGIYAERFGMADAAAEAFGKTRLEEDLNKGISSWDLAMLHLKRMGRR